MNVYLKYFIFENINYHLCISCIKISCFGVYSNSSNMKREKSAHVAKIINDE